MSSKIRARSEKTEQTKDPADDPLTEIIRRTRRAVNARRLLAKSKPKFTERAPRVRATKVHAWKTGDLDETWCGLDPGLQEFIARKNWNEITCKRCLVLSGHVKKPAPPAPVPVDPLHRCDHCNKTFRENDGYFGHDAAGESRGFCSMNCHAAFKTPTHCIECKDFKGPFVKQGEVMRCTRHAKAWARQVKAGKTLDDLPREGDALAAAVKAKRDDRDFERTKVMFRLWQYWDKHPELRLGQLIVDVIRPKPGALVFYLADADLIKSLEKARDPTKESA